MNAKKLREISDNNGLPINQVVTQISDQCVAQAKLGNYSVIYPIPRSFDQELLQDLNKILKSEFGLVTKLLTIYGVNQLVISWFE